MEHTLDNFTLHILNENAFRDYRAACMITKGINISPENKSFCMDPSYNKCPIADASFDRGGCLRYDCPQNSLSVPKDWSKYWRKQLIAMHSTIRMISFTITDMIPRSVAMQLVRHTAFSPQPYVQSSRPDWTGKPRSSDPHEPKWCKFLYTPESFLWMCHKRLCMRTEENTRKVVEKWVEYLCNLDPATQYEHKTLGNVHLLREMGRLAVPNCEVNGLCKCVELFSCGRYEHA